ncbi:hypothetical protein [Cognatiluteimonas profundi]|nr:hypothetical protein [Lysobacter profundi]
MSTKIPGRGDRFEALMRGVLALALIAGVAWAMTHGGPNPGPGLSIPLH